MVARGTKPPGRSKSTSPPARRPSGRPPSHKGTGTGAGGAATAINETITAEYDVLPLSPAAVPNLYDDDVEASRTDETALLAPKSLRSEQRPTLMILAGAAAGKVFPLEGDRTTIGRASNAALTLTDPGVSRMHCAISRDAAGNYFVDDLLSRNGTIVNGHQIKRHQLQAGDRLQVGAEAVLQFGFFDAAEEGLVNQLYESATRDPLTRALNRRAFQDRLTAEISYALRHREKLVAILLDIDHFKSINDTHGHAMGDVVLRGVATTIATTLRNEDVFARYGGEEFVLLGRGLKLPNGVKLAERIRHLVETAEFAAQNHPIRVTLSAGVAEFGENDNDATGEKLLRLADSRLYAAKAGGRNRVVAK
jgi:diguanylate cyclase (GGDEF)-like protein